MAKKKKKNWMEYLWYVVPVSGLIMMAGATMAIFGVPYGSETAQAGGLWFGASVILGIIRIAIEDEKKKKNTPPGTKMGKKKGAD